MPPFSLALLLQAAPPATYAPAPWFLRWAETMPVYVLVGLAALFGLGWLRSSG